MSAPTPEDSSSTFVIQHLASSTVCCFLILFLAPAFAQDSPRRDDPISLQRLLAEGDQLSEVLFDQEGALGKYTEALLLAPDDYEILRRISRTYVAIADHLKAQTDEEKHHQLELYKRALECANKAIDVNPNGTSGYTWRAVANGRIALFEIGWTSITLAKQMKMDLEKALAIDPANDLAWYVLGRTHLKVSEWPKLLRWPVGMAWANLEDAIQHFEKAISVRPDFIMYHLDCARAYVEQDEYDKARTHLSTISSLATMDEDDGQFRKEATDLLEKIKGK